LIVVRVLLAVGRSQVRLPGDLVPDRSMDPLLIAHGRRFQVEDQQVYLVAQELRGLADEAVESLST
jgi:hypothetical protein